MNAGSLNSQLRVVSAPETLKPKAGVPSALSEDVIEAPELDHGLTRLINGLLIEDLKVADRSSSVLQSVSLEKKIEDDITNLSSSLAADQKARDEKLAADKKAEDEKREIITKDIMRLYK
tara:strand:+ start:173 stop:532 length:360 start_codon:yes stop_codon:yes gene_type:complete